MSKGPNLFLIAESDTRASGNTRTTVLSFMIEILSITISSISKSCW